MGNLCAQEPPKMIIEQSTLSSIRNCQFIVYKDEDGEEALCTQNLETVAEKNSYVNRIDEQMRKEEGEKVKNSMIFFNFDEGYNEFLEKKMNTEKLEALMDSNKDRFKKVKQIDIVYNGLIIMEQPGNINLVVQNLNLAQKCKIFSLKFNSQTIIINPIENIFSKLQILEKIETLTLSLEICSAIVLNQNEITLFNQCLQRMKQLSRLILQVKFDQIESYILLINQLVSMPSLKYIELDFQLVDTDIDESLDIKGLYNQIGQKEITAYFNYLPSFKSTDNENINKKQALLNLKIDEQEDIQLQKYEDSSMLKPQDQNNQILEQNIQQIQNANDQKVEELNNIELQKEQMKEKTIEC